MEKKPLKFKPDSIELKTYIEKLKIPKYQRQSESAELVDYLGVRAMMVETSFGVEELIRLIHNLEEKREWLEFVGLFLKKESWLE